MKERERLLTKRQREVLEHIKKFMANHGESPTIAELAHLLSVKSLRTVTQYLDSLERKGLIQRSPYKKRNISVVHSFPTSPSGRIVIPVIASAGCDNVGVFAQQEHDNYISVDRDLVKNNGEIVAIRAMGNSMEEAGIYNGDYVLTQLTQDVRNGERVVAILDGMAVIKRFERSENAIVFHPESKDKTYMPIVMKHDFQIIGRVLDVIRVHRYEDDVTIVPISF